MKKIKDLSNNQLMFVLGLLLVIAGALFYIIYVQGDYEITYEAVPPLMPECTEQYINYKLISEQCPQSVKTQSVKTQSLETQSINNKIKYQNE